MKRNARFELRMTQDEMDELLKAVIPGKRSEFIRKAIKADIKTKIHRPVWGLAKKETK